MVKRKGFRLPERVVTIVFEDDDGPYVGLELDVSLTVAMGYYFTAAAWGELPEGELPSVEEIRTTMLDWARAHLRGWNIEDKDGQPVPATPEAFVDRIDSETQGLILVRWREAVRKPPDPSSPPSPAGGTSVAES